VKNNRHFSLTCRLPNQEPRVGHPNGDYSTKILNIFHTQADYPIKNLELVTQIETIHEKS
jgi:hypothetical protein